MANRKGPQAATVATAGTGLFGAQTNTQTSTASGFGGGLFGNQQQNKTAFSGAVPKLILQCFYK